MIQCQRDTNISGKAISIGKPVWSERLIKSLIKRLVKIVEHDILHGKKGLSNNDDLVKSLKSRHSRAGGNPELVVLA